MAYKVSICFIYSCILIGSEAAEYTKFPWKHDDNIGRSDKTKLQKLAHEYLVEAKAKLRQVIEVCSDHSTFDGYNYGFLIGKIREEYRMMYEIYRVAINRLPGFNDTLLLPPSTRIISPVQYVHFLHMVNILERDIDEMVRLMEWIPEGAASMIPNVINPEHYTPKPLLRTVVNRTALTEKKNLLKAERRLKSKYREEHLMRRLGLPTNTSTTAKRFLDRWPVENTWKLDVYDTK